MKIKTFVCKMCGKEYQKYTTTQKYCSPRCFNRAEAIKVSEKKKKLKEAKKTSPKVLYKQNVELAKKIAKIRDGYTCQKCGSKDNIHGSHIINEALDHRLATYEENIKALCYNCHFHFWHKNPMEAAKWMNEKFPGRYELLQALRLEYMKEGKITPEWHRAENARLKKKLQDFL